MKALAASVLLAFALLAACEDPRRTDMIAVIAESFGQTDCAPVPLQIVDVGSETIRLGPADRWVSIALSPSGDRVAAVRMDFDVCGPEVPVEEQTFTLVTVDVETLDVTEHRTAEREFVSHIHWSPDQRYLALAGVHGLLVFDLQTGELAGRARDASSVSSRFEMLWPDGGEHLLLVVDGPAVRGIRRSGEDETVRWGVDCDRDGPRNAIRLRPAVGNRVIVDHYCTDSRFAETRIWKTTLDLSDESAGQREASPEAQAWLNETVGWYGAADEPFERGEVVGGVQRYQGDASRRLVFTTVVFSPSGADIRELQRADEPALSDIETRSAIRDVDGSTLYVPVYLRYAMPTPGAGPLLDVAVVD